MFITMVVGAAVAGCGGGGSTPVASTTTVNASGGAATITAAQNASANIIINDFHNTGWKVYLPLGSLASNTTFMFSNLTPGVGGTPLEPANTFLGVSVEIVAAPAIPAGRTLTVMNNGSANTDIATDSTVDFMKVLSGVWTDVGTATKFDDGTLRAIVSGFSSISLGVRNASGTYAETFTITTSSNSSYCGSVGSIDVSSSVIDQNGVALTFNPDYQQCEVVGTMKADGVFDGSISCQQMNESCAISTSGTFAGTLDISVNPKRYSATISKTYAFSGSCGSAPATCTNAGTAEGILMY